MERLPIEFHPLAVREAQAARPWYYARSPAAATRFMAELDQAVMSIGEHPNRWAEHSHGTRRYLVWRFSYLVIYRVAESAVQVIAVAHGKRRPGYWRNRAK